MPRSAIPLLFLVFCVACSGSPSVQEDECGYLSRECHPWQEAYRYIGEDACFYGVVQRVSFFDFDDPLTGEHVYFMLAYFHPDSARLARNLPYDFNPGTVQGLRVTAVIETEALVESYHQEWADLEGRCVYHRGKVIGEYLSEDYWSLKVRGLTLTPRVNVCGCPHNSSTSRRQPHFPY